LALCGVGLRAEAADSLDADVIGEAKCEGVSGRTQAGYFGRFERIRLAVSSSCSAETLNPLPTPGLSCWERVMHAHSQLAERGLCRPSPRVDCGFAFPQ